MDSTITALAAIFGSLAGASATIATTWISQRAQGRQTLLEAAVRGKEDLYTQFIEESSKLIIDALDHALDEPAKLFRVYALLNRIRLNSSDAVVSAAERALRLVVEQYYRPNISKEDISTLVLSSYKDPLKDFSQECRVEILALHHATISRTHAEARAVKRTAGPARADGDGATQEETR